MKRELHQIAAEVCKEAYLSFAKLLLDMILYTLQVPLSE